MGVPFFDPAFEPVPQANLGLALDVASNPSIPLTSPLGLLTLGFMWEGIYDRCNTDPVTGYTLCVTAPVTGWTAC